MSDDKITRRYLVTNADGTKWTAEFEFDLAEMARGW